MEKNGGRLRDKEVTTKKNNTELNIIILLLIAIILVVSILGITAYAKYKSKIQGDAIAQVAKWSFDYKIVDATQTEEIENFAITRTDENTQVDESTIAPGTSGEFVIEVDASRNRNVFNLRCNARFYKQTN